MSIKFCPNDEKLLRKKRKGKKSVLTCPVCGYEVENDCKIASKSRRRELVAKAKIKDHSTRILDGTEQKVELMPKTKVNCEKCGNNEAYYEQYQTRSADEAETTFYTCTKCKYKWREY